MPNIRKKTIYIGGRFETAEYIYQSDVFDLKAVICESGRINDDMLTFSLVRNIELCSVENKSELIDILKSFGKDVVYIMHIFGMRIPMENLEGFNIYNIHPSILPRYKGPHPTYWATIENEKSTGISLFKITPKLDDGSIIAQETAPYYLWENELDLRKKHSALMPTILEKLNDYLDFGTSDDIENTEGDYYPKVTQSETYINLESDTPALIYNKVRAEAGYEGAKILLDGSTYALFDITLSHYKMSSSFIEHNDTLIIKYSDELVIKALKYKKL